MKYKNHNTIQITCLLVACILILFACKKEKEEEIIFEGITCMTLDKTMCDSTNFDETDWRTDDQWSKKVYKLFADPFYTDFLEGSRCDFPKNITLNMILKSNPPETTGLTICVPASPNPCTTSIGIEFRCNENGSFQLAVVDQNFEYYFRYTEKRSIPFGYSMGFSTGEAFEQGEIYRMYYRFISDADIEYLGHGDFMKE